MISDPSVRLGRICIVLTLAIAGCSSAPAPQSDAIAPDVDYLQGVDTAYSIRLDQLGDTDVLGPDSAMRRALVAGDESLLVAATVFRHDSAFTLDLIVINHSGEELVLERSALHLVDARGRWLTPVPDWAGAEHHGLRGRQLTESHQVVYDVPARELQIDDGLALDTGRGSSPLRPSKRDRPNEERRPRSLVGDYEGLPAPGPQERLGTPTSVRVRPGDSRAFWAYFEGGEVEYPLTAVVMMHDHQLLFEYQR